MIKVNVKENLKNIYQKYIWLLLIVILAGTLRFWQLGNIPASLNWDEAAWGYNAYTLGIDGKDEFGNYLPFKYLESFGDYKPPLYAYLSVIPVRVFGLNEFSTRFASAFFGTMSVLITYFLVKQIFFNLRDVEKYAIISALFLAISPWHINLSRAAFEANVATFLVMSGVWLFLSGVRDKKWHIILSAVFFALSFYTFNTPRIVVPVLVIGLVMGSASQLLKRKREVIIAAIIGLLLLYPLIGFLFSPQAKLRYNEVNIFSDVNLVKQANQEITNDQNALWSKVIHNRRVIYTLAYLKHYFDNFNPSFLFISGDANHKFSTKDVGEMYFTDSIFLLIGLIFLFRKKEGAWWILPFWFAVALLPAATARETPHALRTETALPTLQILAAYGLVVIIKWTEKIAKQKRLIILCLIGLTIFLNVAYYLHGYMKHYASESAGEWNYGYKDSILYVASVEHNYDEVRVTNQLGRPYAYYAFYLKTDPTSFRKTARIKRDVFGFVNVSGFGKYKFGDEVVGRKPINGLRVLYVNVSANVPQGANILREFYYPDGYQRLTAYTL